MANIIVSASTTNINVDTTTSTVDVSSTISNVLVGETTFVANNIVRAAISVTDTGGDGSLSYDEPTGVITYTGPSQAEANARIAAAPSQVRAHIANTAPILYNTTTGVISIDETAIFSGKTTDDLAQGTTNIYFSTSGATVDTDALPQGNTSQNRYLRVDDYGPSQLLMTNFLDVTDGRSTSGITANTDGAVYEVQQPGMALDGNVGFNFTSKSVGLHDESTALGTNFIGQQNIYIGSGANFAKRQTWYRDGSGNLQKTAAPLTVQSSVVDGINILNQKEPTFGTMAGLGLGFLNNADSGTQGATTDSAFLTFPATNMAGGANSIYHGTLSITNTGSATLAPRTDNPHIHLTTVGENESSADAANLRVSIGTTATDSTNMLNVNGTSKFTGDMGVTGNINVTGNVEVDGNLNYRNVEDLYVRDQSITLNANATTNASVEIIGNRPQSTYQSILRWDETTDKWQFSNGDNSFKDMIDDVEAKTLLSTTTASSSGEGALSYDNTSGVFTYTPADLSAKIELTDLSVTTLTPSGDGALSYDNTSGVFTFTPADADEAPVYSVNREVGVVQLGTNLIPEGNVIGYDITTSNYVTGKLINSQLALPRGMTFNNDGTKMYVVGQEDSAPGDEYVFEYVLTTPFDVTTITFSQSFSVETETNSATDIKFNTDGTKMFIGSSDGSTTEGVFEYDLSTGFNISTASYSQNFDASSQETRVSSVAFNSDGTKMFIVGLIQDTVFEYTLSTGFDLSTASYSTNSFGVGSQADGPKGLQFNGDGTEMYVADADTFAATNEVYKYTLTTGFDITTASYSGTSFDFTPQLGVGQAQDLAFNSNGTKMYILDYNNATPFVQEYNLNLDSDGTGPLYYTDARVDAHLTGGTGINYTAGTIDLADTAVTPGTYGDATNVSQITVDQQGRITGVSDVAISIPATYGNVEVADFLANGFGSNSIVTTGNITADYFFATEFFEGDLNGAVTIDVYNNTAGTLSKGEAVYLTGGNQGDNPHVDKANNLVAANMPAIGVIRENIGASAVGQVVTSGVMNFSSHGFTQGADLYVNGAGALTTTIPTGEDELIQKIGKVVSTNHIIVQGAFRTNATPNLNDGNIFIGNGSNQSVSAVLDTSIVPENTNLYYTTDRSNSAIAAYTGDMLSVDDIAANSLLTTNAITSQSDITSQTIVYVEQQSNTSVGGVKAFEGTSTFTNFATSQPGLNVENGFLTIQASDETSNVFSIPRYALGKLPDVPTVTKTTVDDYGISQGFYDDNTYAMPGGVEAPTGVITSTVNKRRAYALPAYAIPYTGEGATPHSTGTIQFGVDDSNVVVRAKNSFGPLAGVDGYFTAPTANGTITFRTVQTDILADLDSIAPYNEAINFANSTVAYMNHKFNIGREDDGSSYSFPKTSGNANDYLRISGSGGELEFVNAFAGLVNDQGTVLGDVTIDIANGDIHKIETAGDITDLIVSNIPLGTRATIIIKQGTTTGALTGSTNWLWAGGNKTLSTTTGDIDVIEFFRDDTNNYYAKLNTGYVA